MPRAQAEEAMAVVEGHQRRTLPDEGEWGLAPDVELEEGQLGCPACGHVFTAVEDSTACPDCGLNLG